MVETDGRDTPVEGVVLDYLPHGRADDDRPQYQKSPLAYLVSTDKFQLFEVELETDSTVGMNELISIDPPAKPIARRREVTWDELSSGARSELEYVVEDIVANESDRFVAFYNEAGPITLRLHQLNLLPGIGKKLRNAVLDERERDPFESFADIESRVDGLHDPKRVLVDRILEELREDDLKYRLFAREAE